MTKTSTNSGQNEQMRLDKWLWCARFFKSRQLATAAIKSSNVTINGSKAKPSRSITIGDYLVIDKKGLVFEVEVIALSAQRLSATLAAELYLETQQSIAKRQQLSELRKLDRLSQIRAPKQKPDKRGRRDRAKFKRGEAKE